VGGLPVTGVGGHGIPHHERAPSAVGGGKPFVVVREVENDLAGGIDDFDFLTAIVEASKRVAPSTADLPKWSQTPTAEEMKAIRWVRPALVAEISFVEWTRDGSLRHASFMGLRDDKRPRDVRRE